MDPKTYTGKTLTGNPSSPPPSPLSRELVVAWDNTTPLKDIPSYYTTVCCSGMAVGVGGLTFTPDPTLYPTREAFLLDVQIAHQKKQKLLLTVTGDLDLVWDLPTAEFFVASAREIFRLYGLDGLNIQMTTHDPVWLPWALNQLVCPLTITASGVGAEALNTLAIKLGTRVSWVSLDCTSMTTLPAPILALQGLLAQGVPQDRIVMDFQTTPPGMSSAQIISLWGILTRGARIPGGPNPPLYPTLLGLLLRGGIPDGYEISQYIRYLR